MKKAKGTTRAQLKKTIEGEIHLLSESESLNMSERRASLEKRNVNAELVRQLPGGLSSSHWSCAPFSRRTRKHTLTTP